MNEDRNDISLEQAPATVNGKQVVSVVQVTISDNEAENGYKVLTADAETTFVPTASFVAGANLVSGTQQPQVEETGVAEPTVPEQPQAPVVTPQQNNEVII